MTTGNQRMVPVRQLTELADCLEAMATGKGGWAWADVLDDLRAIIATPSAPAQAVPDIEEVRRRFEREYAVNKVTARRNEHGDYVLPSIQDAWAGWKAGMLAAFPQPVTAQPSAVTCPLVDDPEGRN